MKLPFLKVLVSLFVPLMFFFLSDALAVEHLPLRIKAYNELILSLKHAPLEEKLIKVNSFFNQFVSDYDANVWKKEDYWATPLEFTAKGRGDCEDYTIGKYFALQKLGIDKNRLFILIVKEKTAKDYHMVLGYLKDFTSSPLILDNLSWKILSLEQRSDLKAIYGFNEKSIYTDGKILPLHDEFVKRHPEITLWFDVIQKVKNGK